jgi:rhodanese-related sulfurtransferase
MFNILGSKEPGLTAKEAVAGVKSGAITVIDVREASEVQASGTAMGGIHIPLGLLPLRADPKAPDCDKRLDATKPIAVFCAVGGRAGQAAALLERMGYQAHSIGGFGDWTAAGGAVNR